MRRVLKKPSQLGKANWDAVICVYDDSGNVIDTHEQAGDFKELEMHRHLTTYL
jgi:hypothetical protein